MADIVQSLFGVTPEMYQQQQSAAEDKRAYELAQLTPFQRAEFNINRGAYNLGQAVGGALGAQDPQLQLISQRNAIARQINYNDPASIQQGVQRLAQAGDTVGAMQLATVGRDLEYKQAQTAQARAAASRERVQATPEKIQLARELAAQVAPPGTPEFDVAYREQLTRLTTTERPEAMTPEMRNAAALASLKGAPGSPEYNAEYTAQLSRLTTKEPKEPTTTALTQARFMASRAGPEGSPEYNRVFEAEYKRLTEPKPQTQITNVMPGDKNLADIPKFRAEVQATIRPQLDTINATEQALQSIEDSIKSNNFVSFNAARTQLAKALGDSQLSRRDIEQAGGDPSLLGGFYDAASKVFSSTPGLDTQKKIRSTLNAIQTVARNRARAEVEQQLKIALRSPGYSSNADAVREALTFSQLAAKPAVAQPPIYARNPTTNERIMSTDGGAAWAPAPAAR